MHIKINSNLIILYTDEINFELFLRTQEEIFEFWKLYGDEKMNVALRDKEVIFVSETGKTHELGMSDSCSYLNLVWTRSAYISYGLSVRVLNFIYGIRI